VYKLDQTQTPLFDALMEYVDRDTIPFHVPGHKKGDGMDSKFKDFVGTNMLSIDVTVFKLVDSLYSNKEHYTMLLLLKLFKNKSNILNLVKLYLRFTFL
jgi:arginine decarboxylase